MVDRQRNILFGKLAIARGALAPAKASECFQAMAAAGGSGRELNLWEVAVSRGHLSMEDARGVLRVLDEGAFACPKGCQPAAPIARFPADRNFTCGRCGAALQIIRMSAAADPSAPARITESSKVMGLDVSRAQGGLSAATPTAGTPTAGLIPGPGTTATSSRAPQPAPSQAPLASQAPTPGLRRPPPPQVSMAESLQPGQVLGDYEVVRLLGKGGMGVVYEVRRPGDGTPYALKVLLERAAENPDTIDRFRREIKVAARLRHPSIVAVWDAGFTEGLYWMVMEYIEGRDLAAWRNEPGRSIGQGIQKIIQITDGLAAAHRKFIVHRDLKPGNIMVTKGADTPKICDFGLAKALSECSELTKTGDILGTPLYMAPEQAMGNRLLIGPPTDVWAVGVMLYEMATGRLPFLGKTTWKVLEAIARSPLTLPSKLGTPIPPPFEELIAKCLEKDPSKRYRDAGALRDALQALFQ